MSRYTHRHTCTECGTQGPPCDCHDYTPDWACSAECAEQANAREEADQDVCSCGHGRSVHVGYPLGCQASECQCIVWDFNDPLPCACGHDEDDHRGGTGSCEHVVQQFGPLGLFCECEDYQRPAVR